MSLRDWLEERTGAPSTTARLLGKPTPRNVGWAHVFGGTLLFLITVQVVTGVAMSLYYAPTPDHAYASVRYLTNDARLGFWVRGLHKSAASMIMVVLLLHLLRVLVHGAYRRPREVTWFAGIGLFLLMGAFSFTGYLLPWDQKAYWATVVGTNIMGSVPGVGPPLADLLRGGSTLGALTLSRFYALHVLVFPAVLVLLAGIHLVLILKHGPASRDERDRAASYPFYPHQVFRDTVAMFVVFLLLFAITHWFPPDLDPVANPSDTTYVPRPEWYFLSLFELLKYFPGPLEILGTAVLPGALIAFLFALPFLDRRPGRAGESRLWAVALSVLLVGSLATLTWLGAASGGGGTPTRLIMQPAELAGKAYTAQHACASCHGDAAGAKARPLDDLDWRRDAAWIEEHLKNPTGATPDSMGSVPGAPSLAEREALLAFLQRQRERRSAIRTAPAELVLGGKTVYESTCLNCHRIFGTGGDRAPDLTRIGSEHDAEWLRVQIETPKAHNPESRMPSFQGRQTPEEIRAMARYLAGLR